MSSKIWFTRSVCLEVCGWYAKLLISLVPKALCKCCPKQATKCGPRSKIMVLGTPCNLTIWATYSSMYCPAWYFVLTSTKCADLVRRSTMTHIESWPCYVWEACNKVHTYSLPFLAWNGQWLEQSSRFQMIYLNPATGITPSNIGYDFFLHLCPPKTGFQVLIHFATTRMDRQLGRVSFP